MMSRWVIVGTLAVVIISTSIFSIMYSDMNNTRSDSRIALDYTAITTTPSDSYEVIYRDGYEIEIPSDWQVQNSGIVLDLEADEIVREATENRIFDNRFYGYAEPESLADSVFPTNIMIHTAKSDLEQNEYEEALYNIMAATEKYYDIDVTLLSSRWDGLDDKPALVVEYTITADATTTSDADLPIIRIIETVMVTDNIMYSLSYGSEIDAYHEHIHHFDHAVRTFKIG